VSPGAVRPPLSLVTPLHKEPRKQKNSFTVRIEEERVRIVSNILGLQNSTITTYSIRGGLSPGQVI